MNRLIPAPPPPNPALERLLEHCHRRRYPKHSTIILSGTPPDALYYLVSGSVRVLVEDDGQELVLAYLNKGEFFGELGFFQDDPRSATVITREETETAEITYTRFRELVMRDPEVLIMLTGQIAERLRRTSEKLRHLAFEDVTGRIEQTLLDLARQPDAITHPDGMQLHITRQEIAKIVGCSREMAGRVLKDLEERGMISAHGKTIVVFGTR
ncbi:CRP transcriptional dual regulator/ cyclic AMP receptor protein [Thioalkalivibrio nitratireducens DSM 14787]|uniref:CRP transcriptional dual regulator/ cyclic AMP receptor protein n=1 Tax=Thioalkalivibrio nitratireducens (strain DSM 14787 / UNIQEM 213 / ALEN2) TaxID=1255043 RepID=L0DR57_THIND|nr:cAMP-activated global transcriptional regulator CRP [Thioalkalivibrio nitratireducens]AGA32069.1 CRP transcriptional dual regulator/ cyclic AMP receptor protein [Thioalkalivibrio nitratireducens DSM 14787]